MDKSNIVKERHAHWQAYNSEAPALIDKRKKKAINRTELLRLVELEMDVPPVGWEVNTEGETPTKKHIFTRKKEKKKEEPPPPPPEPEPEPEPEVIEEEAPSEEELIECPFCEREYKTERGYEEHLKRKHPEEV